MHVIVRSPQAIRGLTQVESWISQSRNLPNRCQLTERLRGLRIGAERLQRYNIHLSIESLSGVGGNGDDDALDPRARTAGDWLPGTCCHERLAGLIREV